VDSRRFPWLRRLATDYAFDYQRLADFYAGDPGSPAAWDQAIARTQQFPRAGAAVADLLRAQQRRRGAPAEAVAASAQLGDPRTVAVVTGQQAGLFGGPLFTLLKAMTAVRLAERARERHRVPAVAVFWVDAEDHDWDEVRTCGVLDAEDALTSISLEPRAAAAPGTAVGHVQLDTSVEAAVAALESALPSTDFTAGVITAVRDAYRPGATMAGAFARLLETWLGPRGLIVYDSTDLAAKPLLADLFVHAVERPDLTSRLATAAGAALQSRGYHAQATPGEDTLALFHTNGGRQPIRIVRAAQFAVGDAVIGADELRSLARQSPHHFSPNVLLRPLAQDTLFPTACYVAGPSELAYLGQLKAVYESFGVPMPIVHQRASATILDSNAMRFFVRQQIALEQLQPQDEAALNTLVAAQVPPAVDRSLVHVAKAIETEMEAVASAVAALDTTLEAAARSTHSRMQEDLRKLQGKVLQAVKRKDETLRRQFLHARAQAFPAGHPQERRVGTVHFLNRYGAALVDRLYEALPGDAGMHYVLTP
jgi:bacillithiol biosynthesis cysteine-adding enzyme BshC